MENQFVYHSPFGDSPVKLAVASYQNNPLSIALSMTSLEDGLPFGVGTVNIGPYVGNDSLMGPYCAFVDTNNMPGIEKFLKENNLAEPYTRFGEKVYGFSGYCSYPLYEFNRELLKELDPEGAAAYEAEYLPALKTEQERLEHALFGVDYNWFGEPEEEMALADEELSFDFLSEYEVDPEEGQEL